MIGRSKPDKAEPHFISHSLGEPPGAAPYRISEFFSSLFRDRFVLKSEEGTFNVRAFADAKHCTMTTNPTVFAHLSASWDTDDKLVRYNVTDGWFTIDWQGHAFELLMITLPTGYFSQQNSWVAGPSKEIVEKFYEAVIAWNIELHGEVLVFADERWQKDAHLLDSIKSATFDNLVLADGLSDELFTDLERFFASEAIYKQYGVPWRRGLLLLGPPGNGKTHAVKALVNALGKPCLYVKSTSGDRPSSSQTSIRSIFERARATAPCVLVLEDLDSLVTDDNRSVFLNELDGFTSNSGIATIATTNHAEKLDVAIVDRPSRFDRKYHFELPALQERNAYLALWNKSLQTELRMSASGIKEIAEVTDGFSFAYLKELLMSSITAWMSRSNKGGMDALMLEQVGLLRAQMATAVTIPAAGQPA